MLNIKEGVRPHTQLRRLSLDGILWGALLLCGALLSWLSVQRYVGYNAGMLDLGNMSQAIGSVLRGQPLLFTNKDGPMSRLALHVELIYLLFVPFYALWADPRVLLIGQAAVFALGALPAYRMTLRRTESRFAARCVALIYLWYPTAQAAVLFDFHGDTLALPLLMFMLDALDQRAWRRYACFVALALLCKFYVAVPVIVVGALLWRSYGERRAGLLTIGAGMLYGAVAFLVIRPLFTTASTADVQRGMSYLTYYFGQFNELWGTLGDRVLSAIVVLGPASFVAWRGWRWLLPGLPIMALALLSTGPGGSYDYRYHHYAVAVPFIIMAVIDGAARMQREQVQAAGGVVGSKRRKKRSWRGNLALTLGCVGLFSVLLVDTPLNPLFWLNIPGTGRDPSAYGVIPRDTVKDQFLRAEVPPGVALAVSDQIAPHLTNRDTLYLLRYPDEMTSTARLDHTLPNVDYALADALFDYYVPLDDGYGGGLDGYRDAIGVLLRDPAFGLTNMRDGLLLFQRGAPAANVLTNTITLLPDTGAPAKQQFGSVVALVEQRLTPIGSHRVRAQFTWRLTGDLRQVGHFVAVSTLDGVDQARFVHLPGYALLPSWEWPAGKLVQETFDVILPATVPPGTYTWRTGWYNVALPASYATDSRSLLPGSTATTIAPVAVR